jgi:hypothetical protein
MGPVIRREGEGHRLDSTVYRVHLYICTVYVTICNPCFLMFFYCIKMWKELTIFTSSQHCHFCLIMKESMPPSTKLTKLCTVHWYSMYWMFSNIVSSPYTCMHDTMLYMGPITPKNPNQI